MKCTCNICQPHRLSLRYVVAAFLIVASVGAGIWAGWPDKMPSGPTMYPIELNHVDEATLEDVLSNWHEYQKKLKTLLMKVDPMESFEFDTWKEEYVDSAQFDIDCWTWQKRHPKQPDPGDASCGSYIHDGWGCYFNMKKKAPDENLHDILCEEQMDPNDFIP